MTNENQNIPVMSVTGVVELLARQYTNAIKKNIPFKNVETPFLWGPAGVGKSQGVFQLAQKLEKTTGRRVVVTDVRLYLYTPVDLHGIPVADAAREFTTWLRPKIFDMDPGPDVINILFLDEMSSAPPAVQAAAYQLTLDRAVGQHTLPENCIVIAAGNRTSDMGISFKMAKPLCNRMKHFSVRADYDSWRRWAVINGIDSRVVGYLGFDSSRLASEPGVSDLAFPTPRSWQFVSMDLQLNECEPSQIHELISAGIGIDAALDFENWCKVFQDLPLVDSILNGTCRTYPKRQDVLYALFASLTATLRDRAQTLTERELENACAYASRFPKDFVMAFFTDLNALEPLWLKLMKCPSVKVWLSENKKYL